MHIEDCCKCQEKKIVKKFIAGLLVPEFDIENYYGGTVWNKN